ncbi:MAG TPA: tetratricopeptide repeat protein, partial [Longimicrobiaceae bacterium]|nr:tetratricopeptide repeat protein [Longimicrobiaceae bacterium]
SRLEEHLNLGAAFYQTGMLEEAEREFIRILEIDPGNWEAAFRLAAIEIRGRRYREGARRLMRLIGEGRRAPSVFHNLALCLESMGRTADALLTIDEGLKGFPDQSPLLLARGILLVKTGKPGAACVAFDAYARVASRVEARPAAFFVFSVLALAASGRLPEALERAEEGLRAYPRSAPLLLHSGLVLDRNQRIADAIMRYQRAVDEDPTLVPARRALADALFQQGTFDEAAEVYRGLLTEEAGGAEIRFRLGEIAYERGDHAGAITYWRETIGADPHHSQARAKLESAERQLHSAGR